MKEGYIKQYQERNYASKIRKFKKSDIAEYQDRARKRTAREAINCDSSLESRKK